MQYEIPRLPLYRSLTAGLQGRYVLHGIIDAPGDLMDGHAVLINIATKAIETALTKNQIEPI